MVLDMLFEVSFCNLFQELFIVGHL